MHHHHMKRGHHGHHGKMGKFGSHGGHWHHRRGHPMLDGDCHKGKMMMKFGRHHRPCMEGFDEFRPHMEGMKRFGKHHDSMKWKCKKGKHQHKGKGMLKELFRMLMEYSSGSDVERDNESSNEGTDQEGTQGTETGQKATQTGEREGSQEEHPTSGCGRAHCRGMMRFGRHHEPGNHGCHEGKLKMKFRKGHGGHHKDKMIWKCKKDKFQQHGEERCNSMCFGRRRDMWVKFVRMMTEQESEIEAEGQKEATDEETVQEVAQGTGQTTSMDSDPKSYEERNQKDPQSSGTKDPTV